MGELLDIKVKSRSNKQLKLQAPSEIEADLTNKKNQGQYVQLRIPPDLHRINNNNPQILPQKWKLKEQLLILFMKPL